MPLTIGIDAQVMMDIRNRFVYTDYRGITHFTYEWNGAYFGVLCDGIIALLPCPLRRAPDSSPTCVRCWYVVFKGPPR
jgi:hypothetical protein